LSRACPERLRDAATRALRGLLLGAVSVALVVAAGLVLRRLTDGLRAWDDHALVDVVRWRGSTVVATARVASVLGRSWLLLLIAAGGGWLLRRGGGGLIALPSVLIAIIAQNVIKVIVKRPRPPVRHLEHVTSWSYPSGHAMESTALLGALVLAAWPLVRSRFGRGVILVSALAAECVIASSRLILGVHYPTDVIAGFVLGVFTVALAITVAAQFNRKPCRAADLVRHR
jgi:membrane-associated phospholipid phosphatase